MKGKFFIIVGGVLLALYGAVFLYGNINDAKPLGRIMPYLTIILPSCLILAGLLGIFTGILSNWKLLSCSYRIGLRLAIMVVLLQTSAAVTQGGFYVPSLVNKLVSWLNLNSIAENDIYLISVLGLAISIHIFLTGIEVAENEKWDAYIITRSITRILFIMIAGIFYNSMLVEASERMSVLAFAAFAGWTMVIFECVRGWGGHNSPVKMFIFTIISIPALYLYMSIIYFTGWLLSWFCNLTIFIPIVLIGILVLITCRLATRDGGGSVIFHFVPYDEMRRQNDEYRQQVSYQRWNDGIRTRNDEYRRRQEQENEAMMRRRSEEFSRNQEENAWRVQEAQRQADEDYRRAQNK
jgi:hypothetical protein